MNTKFKKILIPIDVKVNVTEIFLCVKIVGSRKWQTIQISFKLEPVFVKHYAPNICLPLKIGKFAKCQNWKLLKS